MEVHVPHDVIFNHILPRVPTKSVGCSRLMEKSRRLSKYTYNLSWTLESSGFGWTATYIKLWKLDEYGNMKEVATYQIRPLNEERKLAHEGRVASDSIPLNEEWKLAHEGQIQLNGWRAKRIMLDYGYGLGAFREAITEYRVLGPTIIALHPKLHGQEDRIVDFSKGKARPRVDVLQQEAREKYPSMLYQALRFHKNWNNRFFWVDERVFLTIMYWCTSAPTDEMPAENTYSSKVVMILNIHRTPIQNQPEALLCLVGLSRRYYLGDEVYPTYIHDDDQGWSIGLEDQEAAAPEVPPLENVTTIGVAPEAGQAERVAATESTRRGKSFDAIELGMGSTCLVLTLQDLPRELLRPEIRNQRIHRLPPCSGLLKAYIGLNGSCANCTMMIFEAIKCKLGMASGDGVTAAVKRCAEMDARLDALSIDFDEKLYPHMLTVIAGHRWVIRRGLRLAVKKCDESTELRQAFADIVLARIAKGMCDGLKHGVEHEKAKLDLEAIEAYDLEAKAKYIMALHALKNLKYPLVDQLERLKDAPMDVIMAYLHLESDTGDDDPQWIRKLRHSSSQLTILVYLEARDPMDPWACEEEILLADAIAANVSHDKKKKKCRVVCCMYGVGSTHHARFDDVLVSVPTVAPQGLAILLADAATQTEISEDEASPRLLRWSSLPVMHS
nr:hypothetical protein [Tanacetum cinerariifolium]